MYSVEGTVGVEWRRGVCFLDCMDVEVELFIEARAIAGVRPVLEASSNMESGPGSEKRTRFFDFFGVRAVGSVLCMVEEFVLAVISTVMDPCAALFACA
jgi:hypothetical protein